MKLFFYGTSLTSQKEGYVKAIEKIAHGYNIKHLGLPGGQINGAAICELNSTLHEKSDYYFIDWFSCNDRVANQSELYDILDYFVYKVVSNNSIPVFLFFPRTDYYHPTNYRLNRIKMYELGVQYAIEHKIPFIEVFRDNKIEPYFLNNDAQNPLVRDSVHTTELGSKLYGEVVFNNFITNIVNKYSLPDISYINKNLYFNFQKISLNKDNITKLKLTGSKFKILAIEQTIGPHSGLVNVNDNFGNIKQVLNWDIYCHYERKVYTLSFVKNEYDTLTIEQVKEDFDRSKCRRQEIRWPDKSKLVLKIINIYYCGSLASITYE